LDGVLWDKNVPKRKKNSYNTIMKSITTYGREVWRIKEKTILSLETDFWRTSANTSRREKVRNEVIREN
jgi:hypothetical protein